MAKKYEFKPDKPRSGFFDKLVLTQKQRRSVLKWTLYALVLLVLSVLQDVLLSRLRLWGGTTELVPCGIFLICVLEGMERGSVFSLVASLVYLFSGSSPGPACIGLITSLTVGINLLRQTLWRRSFGSIMLCSCASVMLYEMGVFVVGLISGLTILSRAGVFALTGIFSCITILPMYPLVQTLSKIGGDTWKE